MTNKVEPEQFRCKFCGALTNDDPSDQVAPADYCSHDAPTSDKVEPVSVEPVAEVEESYTGMRSDGMCRAVVVSHERLSVGAELYLHAVQLEAEKQRAVNEALENVRINVQHPDCHKAADAFWKYWKENGGTHKHGYYESTWGAINAALKVVGGRAMKGKP